MSSSGPPCAPSARSCCSSAEAQLGRGVRAGAERLARGRSRSPGACSPASSAPRAVARAARVLFHWLAQPGSAPADGSASSAPASRLPPRSCYTCTSAPRRAPAGRAVRQLARRAVDGVLHRLIVVLDLLHPAGCKLQQIGQRDLGLLASDPQRKPDHACPRQRAPQLGEHRFLGAQVLFGESRVQASHQIALLLAQPPRDHHVESTRRSPLRPRRNSGMPCPRTVRSRPAGSPPEPRSPSLRPAWEPRIAPPSEASGAGTESAVTRSSPSRRKRSSDLTRTST